MQAHGLRLNQNLLTLLNHNYEKSKTMFKKNQEISSENMATKEALLSAAYNYVKQGISVFPAKEDKRPVSTWTEDKIALPSKERLQQGFQNPNTAKIAVGCG